MFTCYLPMAICLPQEQCDSGGGACGRRGGTGGLREGHVHPVGRVPVRGDLPALPVPGPRPRLARYVLPGSAGDMLHCCPSLLYILRYVVYLLGYIVHLPRQAVTFHTRYILYLLRNLRLLVMLNGWLSTLYSYLDISYT